MRPVKPLALVGFIEPAPKSEFVCDLASLVEEDDLLWRCLREAGSSIALDFSAAAGAADVDLTDELSTIISRCSGIWRGAVGIGSADLRLLCWRWLVAAVV